VHGETRISFREARRIYLALGVTLRGDRFNIQVPTPSLTHTLF
jgi:hypothetical protein